MHTRPSERLAARAAGGDQQALEALFDACRGRLGRLLSMRAGGALRAAELDDLVQEAYLEALRRFDQFDYQGPDSFFRWLATVAINRLRNLQRGVLAGKRDARRERALHGARTTQRPRTLADPGPGPRTRTAARETQSRIDDALLQLSDVDREVIVLARVEGLPPSELAERMGRSRNAVALLLSRALRKLKAHLDRGAEPV
ncbi:MAG: sigma-70 family RNA polymerase sigma factor [Planctomycetota bacterium]|jgi:RNA polymerase sigma-70 factor (ECF subfamily)